MRGYIEKRKAKDGTQTYSIRFDIPPALNRARSQPRISGFSTRKLAERKLREVLSKIEAGKYFEATTTTVSEYGEKWLASIRRTTRQRTHATYKRWFDDHIAPRIGSLALPVVKPHHLNEMYVLLLENGRKRKRKDGTRPGRHPRSVVHVHRVASLLFAAAVEDGLIERSPCAQISRKQLPRIPKIEERVLDEAEAKRLIAASQRTRLYPFIVLALYCGARKGELLALTWPHVDLGAARMTIAHTLTDDGSLGEVKRERSRRTIILPVTALAVLRAHKAAQAAQKLAAGSLYRDRGFVFASAVGEPWKCQSIGTLFGRIVKRAGLDRGVHPHTCRHTFASLALKAGVPITTLAATLGHDVQTLMSIYSHHIPSAEDSAAKALQNALA